MKIKCVDYDIEHFNKWKKQMIANKKIAEEKITYRLLTEEEIEIQEALHAEEQSKLIEE